MEKLGSMRTLCILSAIVFISCAGSSSTTKEIGNSTPSNQIVGQVGSQQITYSELKDNFTSEGQDSESSLDELIAFLPIYLDYKAKIISARDIGYFENQQIRSEYQLYTKQAAYSYWLENVIRPTLLNEFKEKFSKEMKSSHILISLNQNASSEDTLEVYNQILEARTKFLNGTSMQELDVEYSSKNQGRSMGGELPWFSIGATVKPFEDVLYSLEVGEISMPFRTQFGYHIILLEAERERKPDREISHIFIQRGDNSSRLDSAYKELNNGRNWNDVVRTYTQDFQSAASGGKIGWINYGSRYDGGFIDSVMNIDSDKSFSEPFSSVYGAHIVKIDSIRTFTTEIAKNEYIMSQLENSRTFTKNNAFIVGWLQDNYGEIEYDEVLKETITFFNSSDSIKTTEVSLSTELASNEIYSFDKYTFTVQDYLDYLISSKPDQFVSNHVSLWYSDFKEAMVDSKITELITRELPNFEEQTENYLSGLVVYQINEDSVWSAATVDSTKLTALYNSDPSTYSYDQRYYYHLITSSRDTSIQKAIDFVNMGNSPDSIRVFGIGVGLLADSTGSFQGEPFNRLESMELNTFSEVFNYNNRKAVFYLNEVLAPRRMTFEEAFNKLLADYQPIREENWLNNLRDKYNVKTYPEVLIKAFQAENSSQ